MPGVLLKLLVKDKLLPQWESTRVFGFLGDFIVQFGVFVLLAQQFRKPVKLVRSSSLVS